MKVIARRSSVTSSQPGSSRRSVSLERGRAREVELAGDHHQGLGRDVADGEPQGRRMETPVLGTQ